MDRYRELAERLRGIQDYGHRDVLLTQGTVESVHGVTCDVRIGGIVVPDVSVRDGGQRAYAGCARCGQRGDSGKPDR